MTSQRPSQRPQNLSEPPRPVAPIFLLPLKTSPDDPKIDAKINQSSPNAGDAPKEGPTHGWGKQDWVGLKLVDAAVSSSCGVKASPIGPRRIYKQSCNATRKSKTFGSVFPLERFLKSIRAFSVVGLPIRGQYLAP